MIYCMVTYTGIKYFKVLIAGKKKKESNPVKFSTQADLPSEECNQLLMKHVPASIRQVKTFQLLFLRYVCMCAHACMHATCTVILWKYAHG